MGGKAVEFRFEGEPVARVWSAAVQAVGQLGYNVIHSDRVSGMLSFNTGRSMSSWAGQDLTMTLAQSGGDTVMSVGGSLGKGGNPFGGGQAFSWGEKGRLIDKFAQTVRAVLPSVVSAPPAEQTGQASVADELAKLADLRDRGVISAEEFDTQKARLLA